MRRFKDKSRRVTDRRDANGPSRRDMLRLPVLGGVVAAGCGQSILDPQDEPSPEADPTPEASFGPSVPIPPRSARVVTTACDYCIVGCGYKAYIWEDGEQGSSASDDNALGVDLPTGPLSGAWISTNMHTVVEIDDKPHNVVVMPDPDTEVVNPGGDHSVRGGTLAQKLYAPDRQTKERLLRPQLRVDGELVEIDWDDALALMADLSRHALDEHGTTAWGLKQYSYQYYENTYALTKLALGAIKTPMWAVHDKPSAVPDAPGLNDAGVYAFSASYEDWADSEVMLVSGVSLYDAKSILFQQWVAVGGAKLIVVNPRRDLTASYAIENGGMHLQLVPGTDSVLYNAIARVIIERGWQDQDFIDQWLASEEQIAGEGSGHRREHGLSFSQYQDFLLGEEAYSLANAAEVTGVAAEDIERAAEMMAEPRPERPRTSVMLEKGNYWGYNHENSASVVSLGLLVGAGNRPGQVISRAGGHQRGMIKAASYPLDASPQLRDGEPEPVNMDRAVHEGDLRFMWVVGTTWFAASAASSQLHESVAELVREPALERNSSEMTANGRVRMDRVTSRLRQRMDAGGMFLVQQDIYPNALSELADLVLPAAAWGEEDFTRMQGERRLRHYGKLMDPPGQAKPDWWIVAQVGQRLGYDGFDWDDANAVFEEAAERSAGGAHDYVELVAKARENGQTGHDFLRSLGTTGIQCPITRNDDGDLVGTVRLHEDGFKSDSGRANFVRGDWQNCREHHEGMRPRNGELWITNMRLNHVWQSMHDDARIPFRGERFPANILELHPDDAADRDIESGDWVRVTNPDVRGFDGRTRSANFRALAYVTDSARRGVACGYFNYRGDLGMAANNITSTEVDPKHPNYRYKLAKGRVEGEGASEYKESMSFAALNRVS